MKKLFYSVLLVTGTILGSCSQNEIPMEGTGVLQVDLSTDFSFDGGSSAKKTKAINEGDYSNINNYTLKLTKTRDGSVVKEGLYSEWPLEMELESGASYTMVASYGQEEAASFDHLLVTGSETFTLNPGTTKKLAFQCKPTAAKVNVNYDASFDTYYSDCEVSVKTKHMEEAIVLSKANAGQDLFLKADALTHQLVAIQDDFDLDKIIESGQCFRPQKLSDGRYRFLSGGALLYLTPLGDGQYDAAWYGSDREYWADYFDLGRNYAALRCSLAGQSSYLDKSLEFGQGIRILHQDPWEMLITFLISQRKSIPAIRTAVERLARCCGEPLSAEGDEVFLFPTPQQLCGLSGAQLMGCGLGYRTRYIQNAAAQASSGTLDLSALAALPDDALFSRLLELDGVGKKVANCVCLFGYGRTAMAPIDVWIQRLIDEEFGGRDPFPSYGQQAGIVQQYLFYYKRSTRRSVAHKK